MKSKLIETEIQKTLDCIEKIKKVKPSSSNFEEIKQKLDLPNSRK